MDRGSRVFGKEVVTEGAALKANSTRIEHEEKPCNFKQEDFGSDWGKNG